MKKRFSDEQIISSLKEAEAGRLRAVEDENANLKKLLAESLLGKEALKAALNRKY